MVQSWNAPKFNLWVPAFQIFPRGIPSDTLALACWLYFVQYSLLAYVSMGSYIFPYIQKCLEILPNQFKIASSAPVIFTILVGEFWLEW